MKFKRLLIIQSISLSILSSSMEAYGKTNESNNAIPLATYNIMIPGAQINATSKFGPSLSVKKGVSNISYEKINSLVQEIRKNVCEYIRPGTVEVWIGVGTEENAIVVNSHVDTGIKVTFTCK